VSSDELEPATANGWLSMEAALSVVDPLRRSRPERGITERSVRLEIDLAIPDRESQDVQSRGFTLSIHSVNRLRDGVHSKFAVPLDIKDPAEF
jgi:hypothetical protein